MGHDKQKERRSLYEGYQPARKGYTPSGAKVEVDPTKLPQGGTGQSGVQDSGNSATSQPSGDGS